MFHNPPELGHCANLSGFHKPAIAAHHDGVADLIVVTGPPGSGKSTVAPLLSRMFTASAVVAGDDFFSFIDQGYLQPWTAEADQQNETVVEAAAAAAGRLSIGGYTVVYDGLLAPGFLERFRVATGLSSLRGPGSLSCRPRLHRPTRYPPDVPRLRRGGPRPEPPDHEHRRSRAPRLHDLRAGARRGNRESSRRTPHCP